MRMNHKLIAVFALALAATPGAALARQHTNADGASWDGRWAGAWGGSQPTAIIVRDNRVVGYEYNGALNPVSESRVTANQIVYDNNKRDAEVTLIRTGPNNARATIKSFMGSGTAQLVRQ